MALTCGYSFLTSSLRYFDALLFVETVKPQLFAVLLYIPQENTIVRWSVSLTKPCEKAPPGGTLFPTTRTRPVDFFLPRFVKGELVPNGMAHSRTSLYTPALHPVAYAHPEPLLQHLARLVATHHLGVGTPPYRKHATHRSRPLDPVCFGFISIYRPPGFCLHSSELKYRVSNCFARYFI